MSNVIIALSGLSEGKTRFTEVLKKRALVQTDYYSDERVKSFKENVFCTADGQFFEKNILLIDEPTKEDITILEEDYGAFDIYVTDSFVATEAMSPLHDCTLYYNESNFEEKVEKTIDILTK